MKIQYLQKLRDSGCFFVFYTGSHEHIEHSPKMLVTVRCFFDKSTHLKPKDSCVDAWWNLRNLEEFIVGIEGIVSIGSLIFSVFSYLSGHCLVKHGLYRPFGQAPPNTLRMKDSTRTKMTCRNEIKWLVPSGLRITNPKNNNSPTLRILEMSARVVTFRGSGVSIGGGDGFLGSLEKPEIAGDFPYYSLPFGGNRSCEVSS